MGREMHRIIYESPAESIIETTDLKDALLPVCEGGAVLALVLELGTLQVSAVEVRPDLGTHPRRHDHLHRAAHAAPVHLPAVPDYRPDRAFAPLVRLQPVSTNRRINPSFIPFNYC